MKKLLNGLTSIALTLLFLGVALALISRLLGYQLLIVLSGSMEPTYPVGSLIVAKPVNFNSLAVGDAISFSNQDNRDKVVTHRIVEINQEQGLVYTQGDANQAPDAQGVAAEDLIGKVTFGIPYLGYFFSSIQSKLGKLLIFLSLIILLMSQVIRKFFKHEHTKPPQGLSSKGEELG